MTPDQARNMCDDDVRAEFEKLVATDDRPAMPDFITTLIGAERCDLAEEPLKRGIATARQS